jgi:H+/Cl- antiporter ClcA
MRQSRPMVISAALLGIGLIVTMLASPADACAVCVGSSAEDYGFFWGVLFLMSMPFAVGSLIGAWLLYHYHWAQTGSPTSGQTSNLKRGGFARASKASVPESHLDDVQRHDA